MPFTREMSGAADVSLVKVTSSLSAAPPVLVSSRCVGIYEAYLDVVVRVRVSSATPSQR
jgi:hypothetical protein